MENAFHDIPAASREEIFTTILHHKDFKLERIVSFGQATPEGHWLQQEKHEWVMLLSGAATISFQADIKEYKLVPGDHLNIPAHTPHRVEWTDQATPTVWLAVHY